MSETIRRKGGRPKVGATPITVRIPPDDLAQLDRWIEANHPGTSRPEAIRQIMQLVIRQFLAADL